MKRHFFHRQHKANGQGLVEFALILPILLLLLFGIIDMGWVAFNFSQLYNGVREGVRYGSVPGFPPAGGKYQYVDCYNIRQRVILMAQFAGLKNQTPDIVIEYDDGRPIDSTNSKHSRVGTCPTSGTYSASSDYVSEDGSRVHPQNVQNGDRIVITVNASLHFLTPFLAAMAPNGLPVSFTTARSVFPSGLLALNFDATMALS